MIQHYLATLSLYLGIFLLIVGLLISLSTGIIGVLLIAISPYILNDEYELSTWEKQYLKLTK